MGGLFKKITVPTNRPLQSLLQGEQRPPAKDVTRLGRAQVLVANLIAGLAFDNRLEVGIQKPQD